MNPEEIKEMFEYNDPARYLSYCRAVEDMLQDADLTDAAFRASCAALQSARIEGTRLCMGRIKGGFSDDE